MSEKISFILGDHEAEHKRLMEKYHISDMQAGCYICNHTDPCMCSMCKHDEECKKIVESEMGFWKQFWWKVNKKIYEMI